MNIVKFWNDLTAQWQAENKCGYCWKFEAPLIESQANIIQDAEPEEGQDPENCCAYVILTNPSLNDTPKFSPNTNFVNGINRDHSFVIHFVVKGDLGTNNFTEIKGHPVSESRWETIYLPLQECIEDADLMAAFCTYVGLKVDVTRWRLDPSHAYLDNNYYGWKITANFRIER